MVKCLCGKKQLRDLATKEHFTISVAFVAVNDFDMHRSGIFKLTSCYWAYLGSPSLLGCATFFLLKRKGTTMKVALFFLLSTTLLVSSGCAVIDFLDGKHLNHTTGYDPSQYRSGNGNGGSGHSH